MVYSRWIWALPMAMTMAFALSACGERADTDLLAEARGLVAQNDREAATLRLKTLLLQSPQQGEARFLLG